ncbi:hypothetical protein GOP47_0022799 [Adiantum capillus-veneris]|uniref:Phytocyanin domain-containing protein n=1 Tax=Adiantum capillus-veneris TaxID=13818 RepID=A0A9D4Z5V5_ADICA|nr:hypothetical protein GOP47_0022799 [Adiantum capillus-veneris]
MAFSSGCRSSWSCWALACIMPMVMMMMRAWEGAWAMTWAVGDSAGWAPIEYDSWTKDKAFREGDILYFEYNQGAHDVVEVSKDDYDACQGGNATNRWINGNTSVTLVGSTSTHYFICSFLGHCPPMRLVVHVLPSLSDPPANTTMSIHANHSLKLKSSYVETFFALMATYLFAYLASH